MIRTRILVAATALTALLVLTAATEAARARVLDSPLPLVPASDLRVQDVSLPGSVDAVAANTSYDAIWFWNPQMNSGGPSDVPSPSISLDRVGAQWTQPLNPLAPFPITESDSTFFAGTDFPFDSSYSDIQPLPLGFGFGFHGPDTPGFDFVRTLTSPASDLVPTGGTTQSWSYSMTLRDPSLAGSQIILQVDPTAAGGTVTNVGTPSLLEGESPVFLDTDGGALAWSIANAVVGKTYTLTLDVTLPNSGGPFLYKPSAYFQASPPDGSPSTSTGTSTSVTDPVLGGTFTFSTGSPVEWDASTGVSTEATLEQLGPQQLAPQVDAFVDRTDLKVFDDVVDAFGANDQLTGTRGWYANIFNAGNTTIPGAQLEVPSATAHFDPPLSFPLVAGPQDLGPFGNLFTDSLFGSSVPGDVFASGFDVSRTATPANWTIPAAGGTETVTVTVTPRVPIPSLTVEIETADANASFDTGGVVFSGFGPGALTHVDPDFVETTFAPVVGQTSTITVPVYVSRGGVYKPGMSVEADNTTGSTSLGPSLDVPDAVLGGSFDFSAGEPVDWQLSVLHATTVDLPSVQAGDEAEVQYAADEIAALAAGASKHDAGALAAAARQLADALGGPNWLDANTLQPKQGAHVFDDLKAAVQQLAHSTTLAGIALQLGEAARDVAATEIATATAAGGKAPKLQAAARELAAGDQAAANLDPNAIDHWKNAWQQAEDSLR